jgi:hypothetical protein
MDCNKIEEQYLIAYLFEEATEEERRTVEKHLESCPKCRATLSELRGTVTTMHEWKDEDIPHRVVLMRESSAPGRRRFVSPLWLRGLGWAAAAAVLVLVVSQGSVRYGDGNLTVSFGREESQLARVEEEPGVAPEGERGRIAPAGDEGSTAPREQAPGTTPGGEKGRTAPGGFARPTSPGDDEGYAAARGEEPQLTQRLEGGPSTTSPTENMLPTSDSGSSTPQGTGPASPTQAEMRYASMQDLERARAQSFAFFQELMKASEEQRAEQWRQTIDYLLSAVNDQRQHDMNEIMMRIDAMGAGTLSELDMTNRRLDNLTQNVMASGRQPAEQTGRTPEQARQDSEDEE